MLPLTWERWPLLPSPSLMAEAFCAGGTLGLEALACMSPAELPGTQPYSMLTGGQHCTALWWPLCSGWWVERRLCMKLC